MLGVNSIRRDSGNRYIANRRAGTCKWSGELSGELSGGFWRRSLNAVAPEILIDMPSLRLDGFRTSLCPSPLISSRDAYDVFTRALEPSQSLPDGRELVIAYALWLVSPSINLNRLIDGMLFDVC